MFPIAGQTAGPNGLKLFVETHGFFYIMEFKKDILEIKLTTYLEIIDRYLGIENSYLGKWIYISWNLR